MNKYIYTYKHKRDFFLLRTLEECKPSSCPISLDSPIVRMENTWLAQKTNRFHLACQLSSTARVCLEQGVEKDSEAKSKFSQKGYYNQLPRWPLWEGAGSYIFALHFRSLSKRSLL